MLTLDALLEREEDLARADDLLAEARAGRGSLLLVEGPAGIGKTVLLRAIADRADAFAVFRARGGELEREFPHGVVRQLFENHLRSASPSERAKALMGAAELAAPVVAAGSASAAAGATDTSFATVHGLYWLTANLADRAPLLLAVDDAHWADLASLRFLVHLSRRLEGMPVLLAVCVRTGEPDAPAELLDELRSVAEVTRPDPLSEPAVARLIGGEPAPEFVSACHSATGGVPFLLRELLTALGDVEPTAAAASQVGQASPQAVASATLGRLRRLPRAATSLAQAIAVLGADGRLPRAARLAGLDPSDAVPAADALVAMNILRSQRPLDFLHPIVRSAIYDSIPPASRADAHLRAASVMEDTGGDPDAIAAHLVLTEPGARPDTAEVLRATARRALARGAPESAAAFLRRALQEARDQEARAEMLLDLARAQRLIELLSAMAPLREAYECTDDRRLRARITYELVDTTYYFGGWGENGELLDAALDDVQDLDPDLAVRLEAIRAAHDLYLADRSAEALARLPSLIDVAGQDTPAGRVMALMLAGNAGWLGQPREVIWHLVEHGLDDGRFWKEEGADSWAAPYAIQAAGLTDDLDRAAELLEQALADARRRASIRGYAFALSHRGWVNARRGDLAAGEADLRATLEVLPQANGLGGYAEAGIWWMGADIVLERADAGDLLHQMARRRIGPDLDAIIWGVHAREARGRARLALGETEAAIIDLRGCNHPVFSRGAQPNAFAWRAALAPALSGHARQEAADLAARDLKMAQRVGRPRGLAVAHRTCGLVHGDLDHLEESVRYAAASPSSLELARSLVEFGAALRRANRRTDARESLRKGLDLAFRSGAQRLSERARAELSATGARPRREVLTGRDALTATERRIARMAADGMSNPEIAQALFVTRKTVENHLARTYGKLGINSRAQLRGPMDP